MFLFLHDLDERPRNGGHEGDKGHEDKEGDDISDGDESSDSEEMMMTEEDKTKVLRKCRELVPMAKETAAAATELWHYGSIPVQML